MCIPAGFREFPIIGVTYLALWSYSSGLHLKVHVCFRNPRTSHV